MRKVVFATCALIALVAAGCGSGGTDAGSGAATAAPKKAGPTMKVQDPPSSIAGNVVTLPVSVDGLTIVKADGDTSGRSGHFHVFIDRAPVAAGQSIPKEKGIVHTADNPIMLYGLTVGAHTATVVVGDGAHQRILPNLEERVDFTIAGPAVQATALPLLKSGEDLKLSFTVEGLTVKAADGDRSGKTGHLHLFIDRAPTPAGQPIPKEAGIVHTTEMTAIVPGLTAGEHTIWVVAGDGLHFPLQPATMAKVTVTVQ